MMKSRAAGKALILLTLMISGASAQEDAKQPEEMRDMPMMQRDGQEQSDKMEHMADAMTSMAQACQTMMEREMAGYPWRMAALGGFCIVGATALVLLIVLEVQWIRFFGVRITQIKREIKPGG